MATILALDTSSGSAVALVRDGVTLASASSPDPRGHAERLTPLVAGVLEEASVGIGDLDAIAVGTGPAPFTGLRVGLVTAAMLARPRDLPVWGVPSLDAWAAGVAAHAPEGLSEVRIVTDARRKEVYTARYRLEPGSAGGIRLSEPHAVVRSAGLAATGEAVAGPGTDLYPQEFAAARVLAASFDVSQIALLAAARVERGEAVPTEPLYLRRPDIHGKPASAMAGGR
ncbi:tRNA (adenosine(37)-N6)-threonylcarbamoyltransferase complex dimerization subunit type 1 TsaB [Serinibacter salmoneus]|uniref:tRNA threonylcarbamoyladenosine biosynthesis protein TsaB n=1 Tax=Serinibacter salmoneus TaxID=556530 RepID=A0A2A9CX13_9MICO|nr:tRNA (adenosine(37)-N6)-threonylcarbamoyltransferase complex dimerization subunit type 1 TsaB [Serinibacter salmoneus]PFG18977.1 tRNA threonylcarbamoyladenosine biosynthesis protein TsaB [Serinibacter salmoneus]